MDTGYSIHQRVEATVENVFSFGAFTRLDDGTQAYIRRRELDLDADCDPFEVVRVGERLTGVIVALGDPSGRLEISRRAALPDPWTAFSQNHKPGDVVVGVVCRATPGGVFVRLAAGVDGYLPLPEMAPWPVDRPEELYWPGDRVEAVIQEISPSQHRLELSVRAHLLARERALAVYDGLFQDGSERKTGPGSSKERLERPSTAAPDLQPEHPSTASPDLQLSGRLLILDDNEALRRLLATWFSRRGLDVTCSGSLSEAEQRCAAIDFDFVLLDINLPDGNGLALARQLAERSPAPILLVMSSADNLIERLDDLPKCKITQIFIKPLDMDEIEACLGQIAGGEQVQVFKPSISGGNNRLEGAVFSAGLPDAAEEREDRAVSLQERIERSLGQVHKAVKAQQTILFRLEPDEQAYRIQAMIGEAAIDRGQIYKLGISPVKDVLRDGGVVIEGRAQADGKARYQKLLDLLPFESCLGLPLVVQGEPTHALFFFHPALDAFSHYRQRDAAAGAMLITALLEEQAAERRIQALSPLLISGQLAGGFGHEVGNQVSTLELELINHLAGPDDPAAGPAVLAELLERVQQLKGTTLSFQRILWSGDQVTECSLPVILEHACRLVEPFARQMRTRIQIGARPERLHSPERLQNSELPLVHANPIGLQQVFANVLLNAVQQIGLKAEQHAWDGVRRVDARIILENDPRMIAVRIQDTGPGIHRHLWEKIFTAGFSNRGGSGMGLYLSQLILRQCGGSIRVEESLVPIGATFRIELPAQCPGENP